ncbi:M20/M25/M40 family metallo-hydrolase [Agromyces sp. MMS24-K17]|uniref:M20/M25/M40 family metallo-hydrolase n=1 Tax=Agromyces sp. MMS24-K17 TaxID=3372850 RepID=UPI003754B3D7
MPTDPLAVSASAAVVDLAATLIGIDSVSSSLVPGAPGEARIAAHLAERLDAAGFAVRLVPAASDASRVSLVAVRSGSRPGRTVVLNGHLDTVGVDGMPDPFTARIDGERLVGRGASDMKGGVAGLVVAAERLAAADAPGTIVVALVADEEDASVGAEAVIADLSGRDLAPDLCLIAEPTWLDLAAAHRGFAVVDVALHGRAAHSSQPDQGVDAIRALGDLLAGIRAADASLHALAPHPLLGHGSLMATVARAGTAPFTVAAGAEVVVERRTVPCEASARALDEVRALVDGVVAGLPGLTAEVRLGMARAAWQVDATGAAAEFSRLLGAALAETGTRPEPVGAPYWMESALWQEVGVPTVVCGPAGGGLHAVDEWVDLDQLRRFPVAVEQAVGRFLAAG